MTLTYRKILTLVFFLVTANAALAQMPGMGARSGGQNMDMGQLYGKLISTEGDKPIEGASAQLLQNKFDSIAKKRKEVVIRTVLSDKKGDFVFDNLNIMAQYKIRISAVGFKLYEEKAGFEMNMNAAKSGDISGMLSSAVKDLGNIKLTPDAKQLQNVTVISDKPLLQMNLDRKVYNVEKDITATGGTAVDVMKNVPSVNVDIDGNVTLRNASPQIFIDNRPTTLTLDQIPADQIASVEIITNPSAKYDASGGGSGILNIVLKKARKVGYNGNVRASIDSRGMPGGGGDVNIRQNKINLFGASMIGFRKSITDVSTNRTGYTGDTISHYYQDNMPVVKGLFAFGRLGMDYFVDNRNTITLSGNLVHGSFKVKDQIGIYKDSISNNYSFIEKELRDMNVKTSFRNMGGAMGFKHNFARSGREWTADVNFNRMKNSNTSEYESSRFDANNNPKFSPGALKATGGTQTEMFTIQTDYTDPFSKDQKIEFGARAMLRNYSSWNDNYIKNPINGNYILISAISVRYKFTDNVYAAYGTYSHQLKKLSYQAGLRVESSDYKGTLISKNQDFSNKYPLSFFPSLFISYKLSKKEDMQLNFSRKINRPNFFQLIPFVDFSDSLNLSVGNPNLKPEFTYLAELAYSNNMAAGHSLLASLYVKMSTDLITRYQYTDSLINPGIPALYTSFANANRSYTMGLELTVKNRLAKWWDITSNLNLFNASIKASNLTGVQDSDLFSWFIKFNSSIKLPENFSFQLTADYQAKTLTPASSGGARGGGGGMMMMGGFGMTSSTAQGYIKPIYGIDLALRKDLFKNKTGSLTLQCNDIFRTRINATHASTAWFVQDNRRLRDPQVLRLNFNWRFGKFDASLFKRKNIKGEMENMQNMQGMGQ
ncbi:MAG: TonB-dependent receptor [Ferruginibacter sp.]